MFKIITILYKNLYSYSTELLRDISFDIKVNNVVICLFVIV